MVINDAWKLVGWNALGYGDDFLILKRKERIVKSDQCNLAKDPLMVKLVFSLEHKDGKLWIVELTLCEWDLLLLKRVWSGSTCSNPPPSWVMWVVNGENG